MYTGCLTFSFLRGDLLNDEGWRTVDGGWLFTVDSTNTSCQYFLPSEVSEYYFDCCNM